MTERDVASPKSHLLARKGLALPLGVNGPAGNPAVPPSFEPAIRGEAQAEPSEPARVGAGETEGQAPNLLPAASLLRFDVLRRTNSPPVRQARPQERLEPVQAATPGAKPGKAESPRPRAEWRGGIDSRSKSDRSSWRLGAVAAVIALAGLLAIAWFFYHAESGAVGENAAQSGSAKVTSGAGPSTAGSDGEALAGDNRATPLPAAENPDVREASKRFADQNIEAVQPSVDVVRIEPSGEAVIAGRAAPGSGLIVLDNGEPIGTATADSFGEWVLVPEFPLPPGDHEFGLVVKEVQGSVIVPWARDGASESATGASDNEIHAQGAPIPARKPVPSDSSPGGAELSSGTVGNASPVPTPKPASAEARISLPGEDTTAAGGDFAVQLATVKTIDAANREWLELQRRFPDNLANMKLSLHEAKLAGSGAVIRVRAGTFASRNGALELCARFAAQNQECLVTGTFD